jgi:predicted MFS family arabinose efflux permease
VLISAIGAADVMWLDAASYLVSFGLVALLVGVAREVHGDSDAGGLWAGFAYLRRDPLLWRAALTPLIYGFVFPILIASFPVVAYRQYDRDPRVAGWLLMSYGGGSVAGSVAAYMILAKVEPVTIMIGAVIGLAAPMWLLVPHVPLGVMIFALAVSGFSNPLANAPFLGIFSARVPRALQAKVLQVIITANQVAGPLGYVLAGVLFASIGLRPAYALAAALASVAAVSFVLAIRQFPPAVAQEAA